MAKLAVLRHNEGIRIDPDRLAGLYAELGDLEADRAICRAIKEISAQIAAMQRFAVSATLDNDDRHALIRAAETVIRAANRLGLKSLVRVAADVIAASAQANSPALAATMARLARIGDRSLTAAWDLNDPPLSPQ